MRPAPTSSAARGTRDVPIIFLTAIGAGSEHSARGSAAGAVDYISKPCDPWALRAKVAVFTSIYLERHSQWIPAGAALPGPVHEEGTGPGFPQARRPWTRPVLGTVWLETAAIPSLQG